MTAASGETPLPPLWRNHDFQKLWIGQTTSSVGASMSYLVYPLVGLALTGSPVIAALAGTAARLGSVVTMLPAGAWVDRMNRKRVMVWTNAALAVLYASLAVAMLDHRLTVVHLVAVALIGSMVGAFFFPAEQAAVRTIVPTTQLPTAFSQNEARGHVGSLVGPPLGGALYAVSRWAPFAVDAATYLSSAVLVSTIRTPLPAPPSPEQPIPLRTQLAEGLRFVLDRAFFRAVALFAVLANFAFGALLTAIVLKLGQAGVNPAAIGSINAAEAAAGLVGAFLAPSLIKRVPSGWLTITLGLIFGVAVVPIALTDHVVVIAASLAFAGLLTPAGNAAIFSYLTAVTPDRLQGRVGTALPFLATLLEPLAPITAGVLLHVVGGRTTLLVLAVLIAGSVVPLLVTREVRALPTPDRWDVPAEIDADLSSP